MKYKKTKYKKIKKRKKIKGNNKSESSWIKKLNKAGITQRKKLLVVFMAIELALVFLLYRVFYIQAFEAEFLQAKAFEQHTRDRLIKPDRGNIYDRNLVGLAVTETASSVSVIKAQIEDEEYVARVLSEKLDMDYDEVLKKVGKKVALERIKEKVDKELADEIRALNIPGIIIDDDIKRVYPYSSLAAQIIGFVGKDNQGIIGLEARYDEYLKGEQGKILTQTDAAGINVTNGIVVREDPIPGANLVTSIDYVIQQYAEQTIKKTLEVTKGERGLIVVMNPQNGEIYAIANEPSFDLNEPFTINSDTLAAVWDRLDQEDQLDYLNQMWRNFALNDTYEPGSTFKIVTSAAGFEEGVVSLNSTFNCNTGREVGGRFIKCWRSPRSHGTLNFFGGLENSCNPVFMDIGAALGPEKFMEYMKLFQFDKKTGVDLPGEAVGIMHKPEDIGSVELATMSFGQSFQITPLQLMRAFSATINGGYLVTPHVGTRLIDKDGYTIEELAYEKGEQIISTETSDIMREALESVVYTGTGNRTYLPGYRIGGKTATSEKLPRRSGKYIASFVSAAPMENPEVLVLTLVDEPKGAYYGGQVTGPPTKELLSNILPYLGIEPDYNEEEIELEGVPKVVVPDLINLTIDEAKKLLKENNLDYEIRGETEGQLIINQFPLPGESVNQNSEIILFFPVVETVDTGEESSDYME